ncbi:MAG: superoxide dismutase [Cyclobacteriaceae bacterium]
MNKRDFLKTATMVGLTSFLKPVATLQAKASRYNHQLSTGSELTVEGPFKADALPYAYDALEPHIDKATMQLHHDKHYQGYINKLNAAIVGTQYESMVIEDILKKVGKNNTAIRNNGGGYYNHTLFWKWMSPNSGQQPEGSLAEAINSAFGTLDEFKTKFSEAARGVFGSGWAWLLSDKNGQLSIGSTPNQDSPLMGFTESKGTPILGLDVWEHAYYLKYQNKRPDYINAWMRVINWQEVAGQYASIG